MSGFLCALWIGLVSLATVWAVRPCPSLAAFSAVEGATPSWFFLSDYSLLNFEISAASQDGAHAAFFQLAVRWEFPPSPIMAGRVRAPHILLVNSRSCAQPALAVRAAVERF